MANVAVITGAAQGIGRRTAQVLNEQGWSLLLLDLQPVDVSEYKSALALAGDISDEQFVEYAAQQ
jgi:NAD(P)-dependent dehydrogenase (short-subunit alcohol dehydrogenase family)